MRQLHIYFFCISFLAHLTQGIAQNENIEKQTIKDSLSPTAKKDSLIAFSKALRLGTDLYRLIRSQADPDFQGWEFVADFRLKNSSEYFKWYTKDRVVPDTKSDKDRKYVLDNKMEGACRAINFKLTTCLSKKHVPTESDELEEFNKTHKWLEDESKKGDQIKKNKWIR